MSIRKTALGVAAAATPRVYFALLKSRAEDSAQLVAAQAGTGQPWLPGESGR